MAYDDLRDLQVHCADLANFFNNLTAYGELSFSRTINKGENLNSSDISAWLHIASSIVHVDVDTVRFDATVMWCSSASNYYQKQSLLFSQIVTQLATFNFIWGALESVIKIIDPPKIARSSSIIDRACNYLKLSFEPHPYPQYYEDLVADLRHLLQQAPAYGITNQDFRLHPFLGISGLGLHIIRRIRNKFAHGAFRFPEPEGWSGDFSGDAELISLSCRILLMTIQMLLIAFLKGNSLSVNYIGYIKAENNAMNIADSAEGEDEGDDYDELEEPETVDAALLLQQLHVCVKQPPKYQLQLPFA